MKREEISPLQFFYIMLGFEIGNSIIFGIGAGARQDAWLSIFISMILGLLLVWIYLKLYDYFPGDTLIQMIPKIVGKYFSYPLIVIYIVYFTYLASRACRDVGELVSQTALTNTPMIMIIGSFMVLIIYCLRGGVESLSRMGELILPVYLLTLLIIWLLFFSIQGFNIKELTPVLGEGIKPVLREVFPSVLTFPFGEAIIMTMFFPLINNNRHVKKAGLAVILIVGLLLMINSVLLVSVLGTEINQQKFFPFLIATKMVSIADFFERFDALVIFMMVEGVFFKVGGWTYGAAKAISQLFQLKENDSILIPLGTIITILSMLIGANFVEHLEMGFHFTMLYVHIPLEIVVPMILFCIAAIRKKIGI